MRTCCTLANVIDGEGGVVMEASRPRRWAAVTAVAGFQARGLIRADLPAETAARAIISLNLGFVAARLLLAPEAECDEEAELALTTRMVTDLLQAK